MANNKAFSPPIVASVSPALNAAIDNGTAQAGAEAPISKEEAASFVWGTTPTEGRYIIIETTFSGSSYLAPQVNATTKVNQRLAYLWPGSMFWVKVKTGGYRLFAALSAMSLQRDENGVPILDEEGELTFNEGIRIQSYEQGLPPKIKEQIEELKAIKATATPAMLIAIEKTIAQFESKAGWAHQTLDSKSFVSSVCQTGDVLPPVTLNLNLPLNPKESQRFVQAAANLKGKGALLRFYIPLDRVHMPKEKWEPVKTTVGNSLIELKHPITGTPITGPVFQYGNRLQPIAKIELIPGQCLPSSKGIERLWSKDESDKIWTNMKRPWGSSEETDLRLWTEALKGRFTSNGNMWAHKGGALPKRSGGKYESSCTMWEESTNEAKFDKWSEMLRAQVSVKPCLTEENQKGNSNKMFSTEACEAIIACAASQSIQPWMNFVNSIGGGSTIAPFTTTAHVPNIPAVVEVVASVEPEVKAITTTVEETEEVELTEAERIAAIIEMANEEGLYDLEWEAEIPMFGDNIQE